ncbi:MAG: beta-ketoacyl synthase chain length factor [Opitutaceae bacterium]|jgi:hypothetical protein|nr:beta-ketoacyl synthase chain length factor [Opitutaceae bacterium]
MPPCFFTMFERIIQALHTDAPGDEEPSATRERLKACFPPGAARRMTQLGMLVSAALARVAPGADDAIIHATQFGEGRALESFLESFPSASPTGFQTSIHPGAVQQGMIRRAQPVRELFPMAGGAFLPGQALLAAMLSPAPRAVLCGGEERGTWLREVGAASGATFAYALALARPAEGEAQRGAGIPPEGEKPLSSIPSGQDGAPGNPQKIPNSPAPKSQPRDGPDGFGRDHDACETHASHGHDRGAPGRALGRVLLAPVDGPAAGLAPAEWFALLHGRKNFNGVVAPGWRLRLDWSDA